MRSYFDMNIFGAGLTVGLQLVSSFALYYFSPDIFWKWISAMSLSSFVMIFMYRNILQLDYNSLLIKFLDYRKSIHNFIDSTQFASNCDYCKDNLNALKFHANEFEDYSIMETAKVYGKKTAH